MATLDKKRADEQKLLCEIETDDNVRMLRRFDKASEEHLQDLEAALMVLPCVIAAMKECTKSAANLDSRRNISLEFPALRPVRDNERARSRSQDRESCG